ncbi:protein toll-like [Pomacea canaliculata]|uniref:protein toll-like n=1 Tax=Pomacea canaliculata TaxID=400727 RepID=UPI000D72599F|nr:protein toll-like [Pomacea canaliculata]
MRLSCAHPGEEGKGTNGATSLFRVLFLLLLETNSFGANAAVTSCPHCEARCCSLHIQLYKQLRVDVNCTQPHHAVIVVDKETTTVTAACNETSLIHDNGCLTDLPVNICDFPSIRAVSLRYNNLTTFPRLTCLHRLLVLNLTGNAITQVPEGAFHGLPELREVYLDGNVITSIHPDAFDPHVTALQIFTIANNLLTVVNPWLFFLPYEFCEFDFSNNHIKDLSNEHHRNINMSENYGPGLVNFSYNNIVSPGKEFMKFGIKNIDQTMKFVMWGFDFRHNPFHCDCQMYELIGLFDNLTLFVWADALNVTCGSPPKFKDVPLNKVPLDELVCNVTENCPSSCTCTKRPYYQDLLVNCTYKRLPTLPDDTPEGSLTMNMIQNAITRLDWQHYLKRVIHLNLTDNHLRDIDWQAALALRNVKTLDLRGNDLHHVPSTLQVVSPNALYLDTHTLRCTCDLEWFAAWARYYVGDNIRKVTCLSEKDGRHVLLINATRKELGCEENNDSTPHVTLVSIILVVAVVVATPILAVVFRHEVLVLKHRLFYRHHTEKHFPALLDDLRYDVFVSTASDSDNDATWVSRILLPAMDRRRLTYFVPQRDYLPGAIPMDEVVQTLRQSKCALILLSPDYLAQPICCFQFRQAYDMMVKEGRGRVFVVCLQKVKRGQVQDRFLRAMLNLNMAYSGHCPEHLDAVLSRI